MTLQSSGAISLYDVQVEFGGSNPIGIDEYYGRATGIPASGTISLYDFYGKSAAASNPDPAFWTGGIFGYFGSNSTSVNSSSVTSNTITPGSNNSPKTLEIYISIPTVSPYGGGTLRYYQGGVLTNTWNAVAFVLQVTNTFSFAGSSMRFDSYLQDLSTFEDQYPLCYVNAPAIAYGGVYYYGRIVFQHYHNLGGGGYNDYDIDN